MELIIEASVGGRNVRRITLALLLLLSSPFFFFFFFAAAAHSPPSTATTADLAQYNTNSVLKLPTDADNTALERKEACCGKCGPCLRTWPDPACSCRDVLQKCPSWCSDCMEVEGGHRCMDVRPNYCKDNCRQNGRCCNNCGVCTRSIPPKCTCADVMSECPSWCTRCNEVDQGFVCADWVVNYCDQNCS